MTTETTGSAKGTTAKAATPAPTLDAVLAAQLAIAWAGEAGERTQRLKWWRTDLVSEDGGYDLFRQLMPHTWGWATIQAAREAARRVDAEMRGRSADADQLVTLFRLGFAIDERLDERLADLKRAAAPPGQALPALGELLHEKWSKEGFAEWLAGHGGVDVETAPVGRRIRGEPPTAPELLVKKLVGALSPLAATYPMPHYRRAR